MSVQAVTLSEIAEVKLGRQRSPKDHDGPNMRKYLRAANVGWSGLLLDDVKEMNFTDAELAQFRLEPGDILLNEASGSPREVGKPAIWHGEIADCAFQNTLLRVRPSEQVDPRYLLHFFRREAGSGAFVRGSRGTGINHIGRATLAQWPIPLPALDEQRRIAAILDHADALRAKRREALARLDELTQSIFVDMFGDPVANDRDWPAGVVADFVDGFEGGRNIVGSDDTCDGFRVLKVSAVTSLSYRESENKRLPADYAPPANHLVRAGDLLFSRANTSELVGATALVTETDGRTALPDKLWRFKWKDESSAVPGYVAALFQRPSFRQKVSDRATGSSGSMKNISQGKVLSIPVGLPPTTLQREFETRRSAIARVRANHRAALAELDSLFASLQSRAFRGEL
ncbi:restriction endonuclease subunit S [Rhodococcus sp. NPDC054953]